MRPFQTKRVLPVPPLGRSEALHPRRRAWTHFARVQVKCMVVARYDVSPSDVAGLTTPTKAKRASRVQRMALHHTVTGELAQGHVVHIHDAG